MFTSKSNYDLNGLLIFAAVVEEKGFTRAAERLSLPRSSVSRKVAELERRLGARLLNRTTRSVTPTEAGEALYAVCARIEGEIESVETVVGQHVEQPGGVLRVSIPDTPGGLFLGQWLADFQRAYPQIRLELQVTDRLLNLVDARLDAAIRVGPLASSGLVAQRLARTSRWVCASPALCRRLGGPFDGPEQLQGLPAVAFADDLRRIDGWPLQSVDGGHAREVSPDWQAAVNDMATLVGMVQAGAGLGLIPGFVARPHVQSGSLVNVLPGWSGPQAEFFLVYAQRELMPAKLKAFTAFMRERFRRNAALFEVP